MEELLEIFPLVLYMLGIILLVILIILSIKMIRTIDKTNAILEDAYNKSKSLNGIFHAIDSVTDTITTFSDSIVTNLTAIIGKVFHKRKYNKKEND